MIEDRSILLQLWSGFALPTPQQNRKARVQCNPAGKPLKFRGALSKQAEPALGERTTARLDYRPAITCGRSSGRQARAARTAGSKPAILDRPPDFDPAATSAPCDLGGDAAKLIEPALALEPGHGIFRSATATASRPSQSTRKGSELRRRLTILRSIIRGKSVTGRAMGHCAVKPPSMGTKLASSPARKTTPAATSPGAPIRPHRRHGQGAGDALGSRPRTISAPIRPGWIEFTRMPSRAYEQARSAPGGQARDPCWRPARETSQAPCRWPERPRSQVRPDRR